MAKYQVRLNVIPNGCKGEGNFWWFKDEEIPQPSKDSNYGINPRHWSTTALEIITYQVLPNLTGKEWDVSYNSEDPDCVMVRYESKDEDVAILELCDAEGFISLRWSEEDRIHPGPALTVFANGKTVSCNNAREAAASVCQAIFDNCGPNRRMNLPAKR